MSNPVVLGISGSLRSCSINSLFLRTMAQVCPPTLDFHISDLIRELPLFNPDTVQEPPVVTEWKRSISKASMVIIVSPEYVHGLPGAMKNALDWLVADANLMHKPVSFPNLSVRAEAAQNQMTEILRILGCDILPECSPRATFEAPYIIRELAEDENIQHPEIKECIQDLWRNIERNIFNSHVSDFSRVTNAPDMWQV